jgi:hypothetical protein
VREDSSWKGGRKSKTACAFRSSHSSPRSTPEASASRPLMRNEWRLRWGVAEAGCSTSDVGRTSSRELTERDKARPSGWTYIHGRGLMWCVIRRGCRSRIDTSTPWSCLPA